jgi:regulator of sirC expression with transglutaminase-like and TPR domain
MMNTPRPLERAADDSAPADFLRALGEQGEGPHDIATAALMLAALDRRERKLAPFHAQLSELAAATRNEAMFSHDAESAALSLSNVIAGRYGYEGERAQYDDPQNADLMSVIERRRGLPVALGILYIHAARANGMQAEGLLSPGHFLLRVVLKGNEVILDPFNNGALLDREQVNTPNFGAPLLPPESNASGQPDPFMPVSDIDVLLRLQNNIKTRALRSRETGRAVEIMRRMVLIAPQRNYLWLELAHLQEIQGALSAARSAYETCIKLSRQGDDLCNEAAFALQALKRRLN